MGKNKRRIKFRPLHKIFLIISEGKTEKNYFDHLKIQYNNVTIYSFVTNKGTSPSQTMKSAKEKKRLKGIDYKRGDEVWIVIDYDNRPEDTFNEVLRKGVIESINISVSNPKFEYWLLLHFEDGDGTTENNCINKLKVHLHNYEKNHLEMDKVYPKIPDAILRAKTKDTPPCDWPRTNGSTVYRLVEKLLESETVKSTSAYFTSIILPESLNLPASIT